MARQTARRAEQIRYDGTTEAAWEAPDLSAYAEAMGLEDVETTGDLSQDDKRQIAAMTLMGEARASRFDELQSFPVVEPTGDLNRNALDAARRLRGQSADPDGIERVTRQLLNFEFDAGVEKPGKQAALFPEGEGKDVAGVDTGPPQYMQEAAQRGLEMHEEGKSGDGLEGATVREAQRMAEGEPLTEAKVQKGFEFWARNERFCNEDASEEQLTSALLWGGCQAPDWFERKHNAIEEARSDSKNTDTHTAMTHPVIKAAMEDLSEDTLVSWQNGTAYGRIDQIATGETVSGSLEPEGTEHETSDENPGLIIELVHRNEDGEVVGEDDTVFHRPDTVSVIDEDDVPMKSRASTRTRRRPRGRRSKNRRSHRRWSRTPTRSARKSREDTLVARGMGLKTLGDRKADGTIKVGGYGIVFTGPDRTDLDGQYFTRESDFWLDGRKEAAAFPIYSHGMDEVMGLKRFSKEPWTAKVEDAGVWMEGQLEIADEYDEMLVEEGIKPGKMGLSTGVPPHLVQVSRKGGAEHIDVWPFGEVSITPQPAEPDTRGLSVEGAKAAGRPRPSRPTSLKSLAIPAFHDALGLEDPTAPMPMKARSTNDKLDMIHDAFRSRYDNQDRSAYIAEVFMEEGFVVAYLGGAHFRIPMEMTGASVTFASESDWTEVIEDSTWVPVEEMEDGQQGMHEDGMQEGEEDDMKALASGLGEQLKEMGIE